MLSSPPIMLKLNQRQAWQLFSLLDATEATERTADLKPIYYTLFDIADQSMEGIDLDEQGAPAIPLDALA